MFPNLMIRSAMLSFQLMPKDMYAWDRPVTDTGSLEKCVLIRDCSLTHIRNTWTFHSSAYNHSATQKRASETAVVMHLCLTTPCTEMSHPQLHTVTISKSFPIRTVIPDVAIYNTAARNRTDASLEPKQSFQSENLRFHFLHRIGAVIRVDLKKGIKMNSHCRILLERITFWCYEYV
jgi:hypothetical protein